MPEVDLPKDQSPPIAIASELRQKVETDKPLLESAIQDAGIISSRAQQFLAQATPDNLRSFIEPLSRSHEDNNITKASGAVGQAQEVWTSGIRSDTQVMNLMWRGDFYPISPDNVRKAVEKAEMESQALSKHFWTRIPSRGKLKTTQTAVATARGYLDLYDVTVGPVVNELTEINLSVNTAVDTVVRRIEELGKERREEKHSEAEEEVSREEIADQMEEDWLKTVVVDPLKKIEEAFVAKRRRGEDGYTDIDEAIDRANFDNLSEEYVQYVRLRVDAKPRTAQEWEETARKWVQEDNEEKQVFFGSGVNKIHSIFIDLSSEDQYWEIAGRITVYSNEVRDIMYRGYYWRSEDEMLDLRPRSAYVHWARLVDNFQPLTPEWVLPELEGLRWGGEGHLARIANTVYALPRRRLEPKDDIRTMPAEELTKLPSFDRWLVLKAHLQNSGIASQEKLDAFENTLIVRMVNKVLIPGGHESWPGTDVTGVLRRLGSPKALAPLLFYQTYICGASGFYKAGHTNAAAQGSLEAILRNTDAAAIQTLDTPQFVKEALVTLKDIAEQPMGDNYGRAYLTAGLVARKFKEAAQEINDNYNKPEYKDWLVALLRGMKNSSQPFSQKTYNIMLSFLELDQSLSLQQEMVETLASRIHNREQLGINTRINPDFPLALEALQKVLEKEDFQKTAQNFATLYHTIDELQTAVTLEGYTEADIAKIKLFYGGALHTTVGIPSQDEMALSHEHRDRLVSKLAEWMKDSNLASEARYMILQIFDLVGLNYANTIEEITKLYEDNELKRKSEDSGGWGPDLGFSYLTMNFLRDVNLHGYYECLTDLLLRRALNFNDLNARDLIVSTFIENPATREGISEWFKHWGDVDKYIEQNPQMIHVIFDRLNEQIVSGPQDVAEAAIKLFDGRTYFRKDRYTRDLLLADFDKASPERKTLLFQPLLGMVRHNEGWVTRGDNPDMVDDEEYKSNREFGQETVRLATDKMWGFLDSDALSQQFWAVYTLNLYNEAGEKFREVVDRLVLATHSVEQAVPGATKILDKIRERLK